MIHCAQFRLEHNNNCGSWRAQRCRMQRPQLTILEDTASCTLCPTYDDSDWNCTNSIVTHNDTLLIDFCPKKKTNRNNAFLFARDKAAGRRTFVFFLLRCNIRFCGNAKRHVITTHNVRCVRARVQMLRKKKTNQNKTAKRNKMFLNTQHSNKDQCTQNSAHEKRNEWFMVDANEMKTKS